MQEGCRRCRRAAGSAVGGGGSCCASLFYSLVPGEALQTHAPDRSVAATLHCRGSDARGFTSRSSVCSSPLRCVAVLARPGPRW